MLNLSVRVSRTRLCSRAIGKRLQRLSLESLDSMQLGMSYSLADKIEEVEELIEGNQYWVKAWLCRRWNK